MKRRPRGEFAVKVAPGRVPSTRVGRERVPEGPSRIVEPAFRFHVRGGRIVSVMVSACRPQSAAVDGSTLDGLDSCPRDPKATSEVLAMGPCFPLRTVSACQAVSS